MDARRLEAEKYVSRGNGLELGQHIAAFHGADGEASEVVVAGAVHARHLGGLSADERAAAVLAALGNRCDDLCSLGALELTRRKVVEEEERLGALHDQIVDHHRHQVDADVLVHARRLRDHQLRAAAIRARDQDRVLVPARLHVEEAAETADRAHRAEARGRLGERLDVVDERVAGVDVDAGRLVRERLGSAASPIGSG